MQTPGANYEEQEEHERLISQNDHFKQAYDITQGRIKNLNLQMAAVERRILAEKKRKTLKGGANAPTMQQQLLKRKIVLLEQKHERVEMISNKYSIKCNHLRYKIVELRKEHLLETRTHENLNLEFTLKQKCMAALMNESNRLYLSRDRAIEQLKVIKQLDLRDDDEFKTEFEELGHVIIEQEAVQASVKLAALKRKEKDLQEKLTQGGMDPEEEAKTKVKLQQVNTSVRQRSNNVHGGENTDKNMSYEEAFGEMQRISGLRDLSSLVSQFVITDDFNFNLFEYVQRTNTETEQLEQEFRTHLRMKKKYLEEQDAGVVTRKKTKMDLEIRLEKACKKREELRRTNKKRLAVVHELAQAAEHLYYMLQCEKLENMPLDNVPTSRPNSTDSVVSAVTTLENFSETKVSIMFWLGSIEQRTIEVLMAYDALTDEANNKEKKNFGIFEEDDEEDVRWNRAIPVLPVKVKDSKVTPAIDLPDSMAVVVPAPPSKQLLQKMQAKRKLSIDGDIPEVKQVEEENDDEKPFSIAELRKQAAQEIDQANQKLINELQIGEEQASRGDSRGSGESGNTITTGKGTRRRLPSIARSRRGTASSNAPVSDHIKHFLASQDRKNSSRRKLSGTPLREIRKDSKIPTGRSRNVSVVSGK